MKKVIAFLTLMALALTGLALAEEAPALTGSYEDGEYVIRIPVESGDWIADDMAQDDSVVKLTDAQVIDGVFTARYAPVADGEISVTVKHIDGIACDQVHTFDLKVVDGAIESVGGSYTASPDEAELDAVISGEWRVNDEIMAGMTIDRNPEKGWALQIAMAYPEQQVLRANLFYDCELDCFVYGDGTFYENIITSDPEVTVGEVLQEGEYGTLRIVEDEDGRMQLEWFNARTPERTDRFDRPEDPEGDAGSDWYMAVLTDEAVLAEYPCHAFVDVNGDGVPALFVTTTEEAFIGNEDAGRLYLCADGEAKLAMEFGGGAGESFFCSAEAGTLTHYDRASGEAHIQVYRVENGGLAPVTRVDVYQPHHAPEVDNAQVLCLQDGAEITEAEADALWALYAAEDDAISYEK